MTDDATHWRHEALKARLENTHRSAAAEEHHRQLAWRDQQIEDLRARVLELEEASNYSVVRKMSA